MLKKLQGIWLKTPHWIRNKYSITLLVFFTYMLFFDQNDVISLIRIKQELGELEENKEYYKEQIDITQKDLTDLLTNDDNLERYAREKYFMKKENEDIFVIVDSTDKQ
ncbi:MAG: septum formation initiator [Crocinitomicaceae bacterium]|nr:septum formation initiator [Crocinitomicaceae bacterium]|tara:strand:+ start:11858 stop:12181 length:324 start_codon:yes stop_codon:yes gene_type:complete